MANPTPAKDSATSPTAEANSTYVPPTPLRCFTGVLISGSIATALYFLTASIAQSFAGKALPSGSATAANIAVAVRTLVVGLSTLATGIFAIATLGLFALGIQLLFKGNERSSDNP